MFSEVNFYGFLTIGGNSKMLANYKEICDK